MTETANSSPRDWVATEIKRMRARRSALDRGITRDAGDGCQVEVWTGLALSGGGIRSATVSLGALQALARALT